MYRRYVKRLLDIILSAVGTVVLSPLFLIIAVAIKIEDPGPVFFRQKRIGIHKTTFNIMKFRSMRVNSKQNTGWSKNEDDRKTWFGSLIRKCSVDELPQFFDVVRGDMSLVGTRPPTLDEYKQYESHHKRRLSMKPGITGLWQVSGRNNIEDFEEVVRLDVQYIDNWTFWEDIRILFRTVWVVFAGKGAK